MSVRTFLRTKTKVGDVVVFTSGGWQIGCTYIDHEDLFLSSLAAWLLCRDVVSYETEQVSWAVNPVIVIEVGT